MNRILSLTAALLLASLLTPAQAGPTQIATLPVLNSAGTGSVRPNLMLLYDNSGSMKRTYTPDYVGYGTTCRYAAPLGPYTTSCVIGDPPYTSADFNKQYYNPAMRYLPPVRADGTSYPSITNYTNVPSDPFGVNKDDIRDQDEQSPRTFESVNLETGFFDKEWCNTNLTSCRRNAEGYAYPDNNFYTTRFVTGAPYYYTINVAEYCTDKTLTNCTTTTVGAPAPAGYPEPAKVRWCNSTALTNCQAKFVGDFKYPRFSNPNPNALWYGTITIGATASTGRASINGIDVVTPSGTFRMTDSGIVATAGTDTAEKQKAVAVALALSIIAKRGLVEEYTACVRTAASGVPACSSYGIALSGDNMVGVIPITCQANATNKSQSQCTTEGSRSGRQLMILSDETATALVTVNGSTPSSGTRVDLNNVMLSSTHLLTQPLTFNRGLSRDAIAQAIVGAIRTTNGVTAYVGGTAGTPAVCAAAPANTVCLVGPAARAGQQVTHSLSNNGTSRSPYVTLTQTPATADGIPASATAPGATIFTRTDIVPSRDSYPKTLERTDCAGATCTYREEMINFANWFAYYRTRNQMMKTAVGHAFDGVGNGFNVGIVSLSDAANSRAMTTPQQFEADVRTTWYQKLYEMDTEGSTPLRKALHNVGNMYANRYPYIILNANDRVVREACQQNFTFMTTDGYWNGDPASTATISGVTNTNHVLNNDNVESAARFCLSSNGCVDPREQSVASLADVALYWYNGGSNVTGNPPRASLRSDLEDWTKPLGLVPGGAGENTRLHMKTFTLGLGVDGLMTYDPDYPSKRPGTDFHKVVTGFPTGCPWNNQRAWVWPDPETSISSGSASIQARVDDLWHAAVNGHGKYYSAADTQDVVGGLRDALSHIEATVGAAAAAATSTPNISQEDNHLFAATFTTVKWYGELERKEINITTGRVEPGRRWTSSEKVGLKVTANSDTRTIYMLDVATRALKPFVFTQTTADATPMTDAEKAWFSDKCSELSQCPTLSETDRAIVNNGDFMVRWLRGQQQHANDTLLRAYSMTGGRPGDPATPLPLILGDIASSKPAYLREPRKAYPQQDYLDYKTTHQGRRATVFVGANDGMLHAFDATSGEELWAYAPRITMKKLFRQADVLYKDRHQYTVDGSPEVADVKIDGAWRTVLVGGLNAGGRGYYALDVTDPAAPRALWELCADPAVCSGNNHDGDIGLSFGNPQFGTWKDSGGTEHWVVFLTSGYNNISGTDGVNTGTGEGFLYVVDIATGRILSKKGTGTTTDMAQTPSGLARITAISENPHTDPQITYVYGGDNLGRMWRFDFTRPGDPTLLQMADAGTTQPVTTRPDVAMCQVTKADGTTELKRVVAYGTGRLLHGDDVRMTSVQSAYVLVDNGVALTSAPAASLPERTLAAISGSDSSYGIGGAAVNLATAAGWFVKFDRNSGERVNIDPKVLGGTFNVVTNIPSPSTSCKVGGTSNIYQLNLCTGAAVRSDNVAGEVLSNTAASVGTNFISLPSGERVQETTLANGEIVPKPVASAVSDGAERTGWRRLRGE